MSTELSENQLTMLREALLEAYPDVWAIYLFGSFAKGQAWPSSDLDIALLLPPGETLHDKLSVVAKISSQVGHELDLVDIRQAGNVLRNAVLSDGKILHLSEPAKTLEWEAISMTDYADYCTATRAIREDFDKTGIGYAS